MATQNKLPSYNCLYLIKDTNDRLVRVAKLQEFDGEGYWFLLSKHYELKNQTVTVEIEDNKFNEHMWISTIAWLDPNELLPFDIIGVANTNSSPFDRTVTFEKRDLPAVKKSETLRRSILTVVKSEIEAAKARLEEAEAIELAMNEAIESLYAKEFEAQLQKLTKIKVGKADLGVDLSEALADTSATTSDFSKRSKTTIRYKLEGDENE